MKQAVDRRPGTSSGSSGDRPSAGRRAFLCLGIAGALANLLYAIDRLPSWTDCLRLAGTPVDHSRIHDLSSAYRLLSDAARMLPAGATVRIDTRSSEALRDGMLYRLAVALLPDQRIAPPPAGPATGDAALESGVDYVVLIGGGGSVSRAELLHSDERGSIWRTRPR